MEGIPYFARRAKDLTRLLKALSEYALVQNQNWEVLLMIAGRLQNLADEITNSVMEAKARDEKERNGG